MDSWKMRAPAESPAAESAYSASPMVAEAGRSSSALLQRVLLLGLVSLNAAALDLDAGDALAREVCMSQDVLVCNLIPTSGSNVTGRVLFHPTYRYRSCAVRITANVTDLPNRSHGFHIHQYGDLSSEIGASTGGHFVNPLGSPVPHGYPDDEVRHWGDFGNLWVRQDAPKGVAIYVRTDYVITLAGIVGRGMTVHLGKDQGPSEQPSGAAGERIATGVIGFANPDFLPSASLQP